MIRSYAHIKSLICGVSCAFGLILLSECATVPKQALDSYRQSFATAKTAVEELILSTKVAAKVLADHPANPDSMTDRVAKLEERLKDANERLLAIETIDRYNSVLVQLAEGKDPKTIQYNLERFGNSLAQFGSSRLSGFVKSIPYANIAAEIISLAQENANREEFIRLVKKGQEPIVGVIDILCADAENIQKIIEQQLAMMRDPHAARVDDLKFEFQALANQYTATQEVTATIETMNVIRDKLIHRKPGKIIHTPGKISPAPSDLALLRVIEGTTEQEITAANSITKKITTHASVIEEYKKLLEATKWSFVELEGAIESNRMAMTVDFINRAFAMREAMLKLREAI